MRQYKNIPTVIMQTREAAKALFEIYAENENEEIAYITVDVLGRLDYDEILMIGIGESEIPFEIVHIDISDGSFPIRFEIIAKQVGAFSSGRWDNILKGGAHNDR